MEQSSIQNLRVSIANDVHICLSRYTDQVAMATLDCSHKIKGFYGNKVGYLI